MSLSRLEKTWKKLKCISLNERSHSEKYCMIPTLWPSGKGKTIEMLGFPGGASDKEPTCQWRRPKSYDQPGQHIEKQRHYFANKGLCSQRYGFSSGHVWMWELDCEASWALKNWCFWTVVLKKTLQSPLDCKEIQPVHPKFPDQGWNSMPP